MTEMFGEAWPPMSVPDLAPDDDDDDDGSKQDKCVQEYPWFFFLKEWILFLDLRNLFRDSECNLRHCWKRRICHVSYLFKQFHVMLSIAVYSSFISVRFGLKCKLSSSK